MSEKNKSKPIKTVDDLRGLSKLAIDATRGITDLIEAMHHNIARIPGITPSKEDGRTNGITGLVYRTVHGVTQAVGTGIDSALVASIACDALGNDRVAGITMPSRYTSRGTLRDASALAANLGISCHEINSLEVYLN